MFDFDLGDVDMDIVFEGFVNFDDEFVVFFFVWWWWINDYYIVLISSFVI